MFGLFGKKKKEEEKPQQEETPVASEDVKEEKKEEKQEEMPVASATQPESEVTPEDKEEKKEEEKKSQEKLQEKPKKEMKEETKKSDFTDLLTKNGLKVTAARLAVLETLKKENKPVDAQFLISQMQEILGVDRVTIFRILNVLAEKDVIRRLEFGEGKARYELNLEDHHHLICEKCGKIEDVTGCPVEKYQEEIAKIKNFLVKRHSLEFYGICENCKK